MHRPGLQAMHLLSAVCAGLLKGEHPVPAEIAHKEYGKQRWLRLDFLAGPEDKDQGMLLIRPGHTTDWNIRQLGPELAGEAVADIRLGRRP